MADSTALSTRHINTAHGPPPSAECAVGWQFAVRTAGMPASRACQCFLVSAVLFHAAIASDYSDAGEQLIAAAQVRPRAVPADLQ